MKRLIRLLAATLALLAAHDARATAVRDAQTVTLYKGWNAFCLTVTPDADADAVFANWPVDSVGFYDQMSFLRTQQFTRTADDGLAGARENGMKQWIRNNPGASGFSTLLANGIYVLCASNDFTATIYGVPEPMRINWHVATGSSAPLNFVGVTTDGAEAKLTEDGYFQGLDTGWTSTSGILRDPWGFDEEPLLDVFYGEDAPTKPHGGVVAMDAMKSSDWSGAFFVSPYGGLAFGTNACQGAVTIRNDAGTNRVVRVSFRSGAYPDLQSRPPTPTVLAREEGYAGEWIANLAATPFTRELAAGETVRIILAVDRTSGDWNAAAGVEYGGVVEVTDVSAANPTHFRTALTLSVLSDGGAFAKNCWPSGLWLTEVALDKVSQMVPEGQVTQYTPEVVTNVATYIVATNAVDEAGNTLRDIVLTNEVTVTTVTTNQIPVYTTEPVPAGSTLRARLLVHVNANGQMNLVQRVRVGGRRISSLMLPTDAPIQPGSGTFAQSATFAWTFAADSKAHPFRHARHPDHKPAALFPIGSTLRLAWTASGGSAWNPENTLAGTAEWTLTGLRREGGIRTTGSFTMRRLSTAALDELFDNLDSK